MYYTILIVSEAWARRSNRLAGVGGITKKCALDKLINKMKFQIIVQLTQKLSSIDCTQGT